MIPVPTGRRGKIMTKPTWRDRLDTYQVSEQKLARREGCSQMNRQQDHDIFRDQYMPTIYDRAEIGPTCHAPYVTEHLNLPSSQGPVRMEYLDQYVRLGEETRERLEGRWIRTSVRVYHA